jgi:hypothetical protein
MNRSLNPGLLCTSQPLQAEIKGSFNNVPRETDCRLEITDHIQQRNWEYTPPFSNTTIKPPYAQFHRVFAE